MRESNRSKTIRLIEFILGIVTIALSVLILTNPLASVSIIAVLFSVVLTVIGISSITYGIVSTRYVIRDRTIDIAFGIVAIIGGMIAFSRLDLAVELLVITTAFILIIFGGRHLIVSMVIPNRVVVFKIVYAVLGMISIGLGASAIIFSEFGVVLTVSLIAFALMINGALSLFSSIIGDKRYSRIY